MKRRALLASIGTATVGLAGCLSSDGDRSPEAGAGGDGGGDGDGNGGGDGDGDGDGDDTAVSDGDGSGDESSTDGTDAGTPGEPGESDVQPTLVASDVETVETGCASGDEEDVTVEFGADGVRIDGVATTPNPCHEAVIESATVESGELRVELGFESTSEMCMECVGAVEYTARFDVEGADGLDTVVVDHGEHGGTHGVTRASDEARPPGTPEDTPTDDPSNDAAPGTDQHPAREADPDLPIIVENRHDDDHEIQVTVTRESGETVYDRTLDLAAESNRRAYNLKDADPDGIETFGVRTAADGRTGSVRVKTSDCYGRVVVAVTADGDLDVTYSVC